MLHTLLVGPPGCGKTEFLLEIKDAFANQSDFADGSYGSKAGIVNLLLAQKPRYLIIDEIEKLVLACLTNLCLSININILCFCYKMIVFIINDR